MTTPFTLKVGISECLLGRKVRHDGGHKHDRYLTDTLGQWVELSLIHISEPTRRNQSSRMPSSA